MRSKIKRFEEIKSRVNVFDPVNEGYEKIKGNWHTDFFKNNNDIVLELGCGRGEYTIGMARLFDHQNFIGVDIKGDRIWNGSSVALEEELTHLAFLRTDIRLIEKFFVPSEVADIWITFPDPRPKERDIKKRLTSPVFLEVYKKLIRSGGTIRLKTDNTDLFDYTLEVLRDRNDITDLIHTHDLYNSPLNEECHGIRTNFEHKFNEKGHDIKYLRFGFNKE
jgi:tRNA (guanine-N7-)-methyltransferase